jgi:ABC-type lipoprotein export system ATPase subunit
MVTHDPRYARFAERTVRLFDGRNVEDERGPAKQHDAMELEKSGFESVR